MTCEQIKNLMYFYICNELNPKLIQHIAQHLEQCPQCKEYYLTLQRDFEKHRKTEELSAYIDNELPENESIKIKKKLISDKKTRRNYEKLYKIKELVKTNFLKQELDIKEDYSKLIFRKLNLMEEVYGKDTMPRLAGVIVIIFVGLFIITLAFFGI